MVKSGTVQSRRSCVDFYKQGHTKRQRLSHSTHCLSEQGPHEPRTSPLLSLPSFAPAPNPAPIVRTRNPSFTPALLSLSTTTRHTHTQTHAHTHKMRSHQSATHAPGPTLPLNPTVSSPFRHKTPVAPLPSFNPTHPQPNPLVSLFTRPPPPGRPAAAPTPRPHRPQTRS